MSSFGAIDIGSNAIRLAIASLDRDNNRVMVENLREPVRLGQDVFSDKKISEKTLDRAIEVFVKFRTLLERHNVRVFRAVATSALREAHNRQEFVDRIFKKTGIEISVISGEEEARLIYVAVASKFELSSKSALLIDIGGGSVELTLVQDGDIIFTDSMQLGSVRLLQVLEEKRRGSKAFSKLVRECVEGARHAIERELRGRKIDICVATGGSVECLGELKSTLLKKDENKSLSQKDMENIVSELLSMNMEERITKIGLRPDRADVILPASIVLLELMKLVDLPKVVVGNVGLKDGVLIDCEVQALAGATLSGRRLQAHRKQVLAYANELGKRFGYDELHGKKVSQLSTRLFDLTRDLHKLSDQECLLLETAAILHDVGHCINVTGHHKHSYYIIKSSPFVGLNSRQQLMVACIARYHRKSFPRVEHESYAFLTPAERPVVAKLAALIRIADALDREHADRVKDLKIELKNSKLEMEIKGEGDMLSEKWALAKKCDLFEEVFHLKFVLRE